MALLLLAGASATAVWLLAGAATNPCCCCCHWSLLLACKGLRAGDAAPPVRPVKLLVLPFAAAWPKASISGRPGLPVLPGPAGAALLLLPAWWLHSGLPLLLSKSINARTA